MKNRLLPQHPVFWDTFSQNILLRSEKSDLVESYEVARLLHRSIILLRHPSFRAKWLWLLVPFYICLFSLGYRFKKLAHMIVSKYLLLEGQTIRSANKASIARSCGKVNECWREYQCKEQWHANELLFTIDFQSGHFVDHYYDEPIYCAYVLSALICIGVNIYKIVYHSLLNKFGFPSNN